MLCKDPTMSYSSAESNKVVEDEEMVEECDATSHPEDKPDDEAIGAQRCFNSVFVHGLDDVNGLKPFKQGMRVMRKSDRANLAANSSEVESKLIRT